MKQKAHQKLKPSFDDALKIIEASDFRLTQPRKSLLKTMLEQTKPFSAPALVKLLDRKNGCDPVTIWRTLPVFEKLGIIEKCDFSDDMAHYEVVLGHKGHHHHHIICTSCKKVESVDFCVIEGQEQIFKKLGYTALNHRLEFSGVCPDCSP